MKNRGHLWRQTFQLGVPDGDLEEVRPMEPGERTGTTVTYWASPDTFETTAYSLETITTRIREYAFLNKGRKIVVRDERPGRRGRCSRPSRDDTVPEAVDSVGADKIHKAEAGGVVVVEAMQRGGRGRKLVVELRGRAQHRHPDPQGRFDRVGGNAAAALPGWRSTKSLRELTRNGRNPGSVSLAVCSVTGVFEIVSCR